VILLSDFATETVHTPEILFFAIGILLLLVRLFALPKSSFLGVLGISLTLFGLFSILLPDVRSIHFSWELQKWNLQAFAFFSRLVYYTASLILALLIIALLSRYAKKNLQKKGSIVLDGDQGGGIPVLKKIASPLAGSEGQAFTSLCPGGKALIENHLYDALAETAFIAQGEKVVVVKIEGSALIVTKKMAETEKQ
jgi:membrane-bound serine protease (ClpP class)